ncbi:MAG: hypothetical protein ACPLTP_09050 [Thermotoga caldifontis]|uniref:hypothetical protein n=1 Tax=Thermotoga caldifontis TaxID=1508419 RepID=UPI003C7DA7E7
MTDLLLQIAKACAQDESLLAVVKHVASMNEEEKESFRVKVKMYFLNKTDEVDLQAYEFFRLILESDNAAQVLKLIEEEVHRVS